MAGEVKPVLPLGQKGTLLGDKWEVKGFLRRCDSTGMYSWDEYLLSNPAKGYRWLVQYYGHWTFYEMVKDGPKDNYATTHAHKIDWNGRSYRLYLRDSAKVTYAEGDFYWKVKVGETSAVADYVSPPYILSKEQYSSETIWSSGQYVEPGLVQAAFQPPNPLPIKVGVGSNQPSKYQNTTKPLFLWSCLFTALLLGLQYYADSNSQEKTVFAQAYTYSASDPEKIKLTPKFQLDGDLGNLQSVVYGEVNNNWVDMDMTLVNDTTGEKFVYNNGVEFYYGTDSDGSWTEGDRTKDVILPEVPGGTYYLTLQPTLAKGVSMQNFSVTLNRNVVLWSNFWFVGVLLLLFPLVVMFLSYRFEVARWSESDYSPYQSSS